MTWHCLIRLHVIWVAWNCLDNTRMTKYLVAIDSQEKDQSQRRLSRGSGRREGEWGEGWAYKLRSIIWRLFDNLQEAVWLVESFCQMTSLESLLIGPTQRPPTEDESAEDAELLSRIRTEDLMISSQVLQHLTSTLDQLVNLHTLQLIAPQHTIHLQG